MKVINRIILIISCLLLSFNIANAQDTRSQENQKAKLEKEIAQLEAQLQENSKKSNNALNELTLIRKQIANRRELVKESEREIKLIDDSISVVNNNILKIQNQIDTLTAYYKRLVRSAYKNRDARLWYVYILTSENFSQATRRFSYLRRLSNTMNNNALELKELESELGNELARLSQMREKAQQMRDTRQAELNKLRKEEKRSDTLVAQLKRNKSSYQKQLNTKRRQVENLNKEIQKIISAYIASQNKKDSKGNIPAPKAEDVKLSSEFSANQGKLPWPADGPVLEKYGKHNHPVYTSIAMPFNNGIGIGLSKGSSVKAVFNGEVKRIIVMPGYNKCVLVQHGDYFSFYCKLGDVSVKAGDKVTTGQIIGTVDTIDGQTQLHLQIWKGKNPQNPELWLRKR